MTEKEAIEIINDVTWKDFGRHPDFPEARDMAKAALEKQIPKKPKNIDEDMNIFDCPCCGHTILAIDDMSIHQNCLMCGQKLDWSDLMIKNKCHQVKVGGVPYIPKNEFIEKFEDGIKQQRADWEDNSEAQDAFDVAVRIINQI